MWLVCGVVYVCDCISVQGYNVCMRVLVYILPGMTQEMWVTTSVWPGRGADRYPTQVPLQQFTSICWLLPELLQYLLFQRSQSINPKHPFK